MGTALTVLVLVLMWAVAMLALLIFLKGSHLDDEEN